MTQNIALTEILTDRPIAYHPLLAKIGGSAQAGVFLSQLLYWTPRGKLEDGWIWKSAKEWGDETGLTKNEIGRARRDLRERGLIEEKLAGVPATVHYRAVITRIEELLTTGCPVTPDTRERNAAGKFVSVDQNTANCASLPELDNPVDQNWTIQLTRTGQTSLPQRGQLSRDYQRLPQTLPENTLAANAAPAEDTETQTTDKRAHFLALAAVCRIDLGLATERQKQQVGQSAKLLRDKAQATPEDIAEFGAWWYTNDWRGKRGQPPTPAQVREEWGKFRSAAPMTADGSALEIYEPISTGD